MRLANYVREFDIAKHANERAVSMNHVRGAAGDNRIACCLVALYEASSISSFAARFACGGQRHTIVS
eukprot:9213285-Pyramimonas_sp.AAC.1